jgi:hypothetical protein
MEIEVIGVPGGDAPRWVRKAWIGITLPVARGETGARRYMSGPLLTDARGWLGALRRLMFGPFIVGYPVEASVALERLANWSPRAYEWWRVNAPHVLDPERYLVFHAYACRPRLEGPPPVDVPSGESRS